ncbi:hypothetical protein [Streptomyces sp. NBC_00158]|uniref:hypothetical protein n=1 Tax=Streptomyces sp. NBC_00158 TaxID=2903627 RepID=UPI003254201C
MEAYDLTAREQEVARLVVYGMSDTEISHRLGIPPPAAASDELPFLVRKFTSPDSST